MCEWDRYENACTIMARGLQRAPHVSHRVVPLGRSSSGTYYSSGKDHRNVKKFLSIQDHVMGNEIGYPQSLLRKTINDKDDTVLLPT